MNRSEIQEVVDKNPNGQYKILMDGTRVYGSNALLGYFKDQCPDKVEGVELVSN